jgi:hypothetical protein
MKRRQNNDGGGSENNSLEKYISQKYYNLKFSSRNISFHGKN